MVEDIMVDRNIAGKRLERINMADRAAVLYELNVLDCFDGSHPYERLRIYYTRSGDYLNAIRVCEAYLRNTSPAQKRSDAQVYEQYISELKLKMSEERAALRDKQRSKEDV
jgi:hypothetical protein